MKILVAEDDGTARTIIRAALQHLGHETVILEDGLQAWRHFESQSVPVLITDWKMPGMDGLELVRRIRATLRPRYTYVILLTSVTSKSGYLEGMEAGADDFISKPFDKDQLAARLRVAERILNLQTEVKLLRDILPICMYCKRIRDDGAYWHQVEDYVRAYTGTQFSHGLCPDCQEKIVMPELRELARLKEQKTPGPQGTGG